MFGLHVLGNAPAPSVVGAISDHFHTPIATSLQAAIVAFALSGVLFLVVARRQRTSPLLSLSPHVDTAPTTQDYYDRFAAGYEAERHHGYHRLIDELELDLVRRFGSGRDVFEAGCGTGLLLRETAAASRARPSGWICRAAC